MPRHPILAALARARGPILWIALVQAAGVAAGMIMVHSGNSFALEARDKLVGRAYTKDPAALASKHNLPLRAALLDFVENLVLGAMPSTVMGLSIVMPFPVAAYRGWVGGIVSVDGAHQSRLRGWRDDAYYLGVLILQLIPYSLAGGAGIRLGLGFLMPRGRNGYQSDEKWFGLPAEGVRDVIGIYILAAPLFLSASLVEFLAH